MTIINLLTMAKYCVFDHNDNQFYESMTISAIQKAYSKTYRQIRYIIKKKQPVKGLSIGQPIPLKIKSRLANTYKNKHE